MQFGIRGRQGRREPRGAWWAALLIVPLAALVAARLSSAEDKGERKPVFETDILPIFQAHCLKCHGDKKTKAGLDLRRRFTMVEGGDSGPAIVPGKPDDSPLVQRIDKGEMPPPSEGKLSAKQRELIRRWVAAGALVAKTPEPPLKDAEPVSQLTVEDRAFWAFQSPKRPAVPQVKAQDRVRTPIDAFLLARLEAKGLTFNPDASREVLLRRLCFDLLGLPPTPAQLDEFLADTRPDAYERLVERLLAQPEYGEHWGRHWLDIAGYADSDGYLAADRLRPEAWRYRDYVIQALNDDLPFDRFLTEQLAGDEMSDWRRADKLTPDMVRQLTATGFLRNALDPTYPGYTEPNEIHQVLADTMQIVGSTFLGLTLQCARCHGHKYDPISQRDYYALQTVFLPALDPARWQPSGVRGIPLASEKEAARMREEAKKCDAALAKLTTTLNELTTKYRNQLLDAELPALTKDPETAKKLRAAALVEPNKRSAEQKALLTKLAPKLSVAEADLVQRFPEYKTESEKLKVALTSEQEKKKANTPVLARGLMDLEGKPPVGHVLKRGDHDKPGAVVAPGVPEVLAPVGFKFTPSEGYKTTGRRLALAKWLTSPEHPLTARVQMNRMWALRFGRGLVPTVANLGRSGAKPSHPELLDWLATEFLRQGWSLKAMHRLMVTSTAYRQSSDVDKARASVDPRNELLWAWRPQRHQGEVLRDSMLAVSGKLNRKRFGPPAPVVAKGDGSVETADDEQGNRRSIYLIVRRSQHLTMLDLFDTPLMEINCPERPVSTVPLQALAMLHGPFAERNAGALADRLLKAEPTDEAARLRLAYRLLFAREPRPTEIERVRRFLAGVLEEQPNLDLAQRVRHAWTQAALVWLNTNEFLYVP